MAGFYRLAAPLLRCVDPETAHGLAIRALRLRLIPPPRPFDDPVLRSPVFGLDFPNPIGLAAGFDKDGEVPGPLLAMGFGFVEIGSVTPRPQPGNPRPRLFRLSADGAVINRMGFNSAGHDDVVRNLARRQMTRPRGIVGINLGRNKDSTDAAADYVAGIRAFASMADYLVINVSSPNTPGLRALQGRQALADLLDAVRSALATEGRQPPLLVKIAPDLTSEDMTDIAAVALQSGIDGIIATNTTVSRPDSLADGQRGETGGLSGRPLLALSNTVLAEMYRLTGGRLPLIGVGGVASGADAYAKIRAGASLVQLYSAMVFEGPHLADRIRRELAALLRRDGFASVAEAVGADSH
jgi:dihydroorotate dehydrogenase